MDLGFEPDMTDSRSFCFLIPTWENNLSIENLLAGPDQTASPKDCSGERQRLL